MSSLKRSYFRLMTLGHITLGIKYRTWYFSAVFVLGGIGEILGYIGRVGSSFDVMSDPFYTIQLVLLALSPGFFSAGLYLTISNLYTSDRWLLIEGRLLLDQPTHFSNLSIMW